MIRNLQKQDDHQLVNKTLKGDNIAFQVLIERHHSVIYAVVRGVLGDHPEMDETVQNVIIRIYRGLSNFRGEALFSSWVFRIARNEAVSIVGRKQVPHVPLESIEEPGHRSGDPELAYWQHVEDRKLEQAMSGLDEKYRIILELRYMGDRSYLEIAEIVNLPLGTVKTLLFRAKAELKTLLERQNLRATG